MNGISEKVSRTFNHFDLPRVIIHAIGIPATRSMNETKKATANDMAIAFKASDKRFDWFRTSPIEFHFIIMPKIGGSRMSMKNMMMDKRYIEFFIAMFDESLSNVSVILGLPNFVLSAYAVFIIQRTVSFFH